MSYVVRAHQKGLIPNVPSYVYRQLQYETIMGSFAYGVSSDTSDIDIYGFCIPNKSIIFPHTTGKYVFGFDDSVPGNFKQWQEHHIKDISAKKEYDITIYNITRYFILCANGNPNMIDSLFTPIKCITLSTRVGEWTRTNRKLFLSKKCWHTFKGYAYSQLHKMDTKNPEGKRKATVEKYGYDVKFAYHVVRLLNEIEQILSEGDLDLERNREQLKDIRRGKWKVSEIREYFQTKEKDLESLCIKSDLPHNPQFEKIRKVLLECLEMHFDKSVTERTDNIQDIINDMMSVISKYSK